MKSLIRQWADLINESYDPSIENSDDYKHEKQTDKVEDYEEWKKKRDELMNDLQPTNEKKTTLSATPAPFIEHHRDPEDPDVPGEGGDAPVGGDVGMGGESCPCFEDEVNEGVMNWFKDSQHWWNQLTKDQKLWANVVDQVRKTGKKGLQSFSKIMVDAAKNNKDDLPIKIKDGEGKVFVAENPIITEFKGLKILCLAKGGDDTVNDQTFNAEKLEQLLDDKKIKKLGDLNGITVVESQEGGDEETTKSSSVVESASIEGDSIILTLSKSGNLETQKTNVSRAEKFAM